MTGLLKRGVDAAYHVVRFDKEAFVQSFAEDLGGAEQAALRLRRVAAGAQRHAQHRDRVT